MPRISTPVSYTHLTSQLDPIAASEFLGTVQKINRELGTTVILTEHRLEEALPMADRALVLEEGRILALDTPRKIGEQLKQQNNEMFLAMPAPIQIYAGIENSFSCPLTVREGRKWLSDWAEDKDCLLCTSRCV